MKRAQYNGRDVAVTKYKVSRSREVSDTNGRSPNARPRDEDEVKLESDKRSAGRRTKYANEC